MYAIVKIDSTLEDREIMVSNSHEELCDILNELGRARKLRFVNDASLFCGYFVEPNGDCWLVK